MCGLMRRFQEQFQKWKVRRVAAHMCPQDFVNDLLQQDAVIDRHHAYIVNSVPAWLASSCNGLVHDIISNKEVSLHDLSGFSDSSVRACQHDETESMHLKKLDSPAKAIRLKSQLRARVFINRKKCILY